MRISGETTPTSRTRRSFLSVAATGVVGGLEVATPQAKVTAKFKAIAFDGFTIFDPRSITALAEELFPGRGIALSDAWRARQFEYTWLRTLSGSYVDFWHVTEDALIFAAELLRLDLPAEKRRQLVQGFLNLPLWPDSMLALRRLKASGLRLALLSNFTEAMLNNAVRRSGLQGIFEQSLSTDRVRAYKPAPRAYQIAVDVLKLRREEIAFAAFGGWDAAGAKAFGYPTFWVNRLNLPIEVLGSEPDAIGANLDGLIGFVSEGEEPPGKRRGVRVPQIARPEPKL